MKLFKLIPTLLLTFLSVLLMTSQESLAIEHLWSYNALPNSEERIDMVGAVKKLTFDMSIRPRMVTESVILGLVARNDTAPELDTLRIIALNPVNGLEKWDADIYAGSPLRVLKIESFPDSTGDNIEEVMVISSLHNSAIQTRIIDGSNGDVLAVLSSAKYQMNADNTCYPLVTDLDADGKNNEIIHHSYNVGGTWINAYRQ
ncbi:MAG: hypothetical protein HQL27_08250 [Candidatus Omnitrophica bacterium]|nr:hypothetical protein [Candidatus Omnitrophota bacterium]